MKRSIYLSFVAFMMIFSLKAQTSSIPSVPESVITKHTISRVMEKTINGKKWELTLNNDEIGEVKLNGKNLPKAAWAKYQTEIDDLRASAYEMDPDVKKMDKDVVIKNQEVIQTDAGDLSPVEKATQKAIEDELLSDKLINNSGYSIALTESKMVVNGKTMSKDVLDKYIILYFSNSGEQRCEGCKFTFQMNKKAK